jgi:RimJ/RimL family protein N-acetyltransferase
MEIRPPQPPLTDGVVLLRMREIADLAAIAAAGHDPETLRWMSDPPQDAESLRAAMNSGPEAWRTGRATPMMIAEATTGRAVGLINVTVKADDFGTLAYSVFPGDRGRGFAPRAVRLVAEWVLNDLGFDHLHLEAAADNAASIRVAEKSGFTRIGTREQERPDAEPETVVIFRRS